jgi:hypothetical protein
MTSQPIPVAVLSATGMVGQRSIEPLQGYPSMQFVKTNRRSFSLKSH